MVKPTVKNICNWFLMTVSTAIPLHFSVVTLKALMRDHIILLEVEIDEGLSRLLSLSPPRHPSFISLVVRVQR